MSAKILLYISLLIFSLNGQKALGVKSPPLVKPWLRLPTDIAQMRMSPNGKHLAFTNQLGYLQVLDTTSLNITMISTGRSQNSFFWSPDSFRLFYRELKQTAKNQVSSDVFSYNVNQSASIPIFKQKGVSGFLSYDPVEQKMLLPHLQGINKQKLEFPGLKPSAWQLENKSKHGSWAITLHGIFWVPAKGSQAKMIFTTASNITGHSISCHGEYLAWTTSENSLFISSLGGEPKFLEFGRDPSWHPKQNLLVYSGGRRLMDKIIDYDLFLYDPSSQTHKALTMTGFIAERWPVWSSYRKNQIIFTADKSTDLFKLDLTPGKL